MSKVKQVIMFKDYYLKRLESKEKVSQANEEDVFIYNMRRVIPISISLDILNKVVQNLSPEDSAIVLDMYEPILENTDVNAVPLAVLKNTCYRIMVEEFEAILDRSDVIESDKEILRNNYKKNEGFYYLTRRYDDIADIRIAKLFRRELNYTMFDDLYVRLSNIFERIDDIEKVNTFRSGMFINTLHQYFYRKDYEHIPGMMIIEAARQFGYSASYRYVNVPQSDVMFCLTDLNVKFLNYAQSNFPIYIQGTLDTKDLDFSKINRDIGYMISFYQKDFEICKIGIYAKLMSYKIFQRLRRGGDSEYVYRFVPGLKFKNFGYFVNVNDRKKYTGKIKEISLNSFIINFEKEDLTENDYFEFIIYIENIGILHGIAILTKKCIESDSTISGVFKIDYIENDEKENLKEAIKKYTYFIDESLIDTIN